MLGPRDGNALAEHRLKYLALPSTEPRARHGRGANGAVVLDEEELTAGLLPDVGHVALLGPDRRQRPQPLRKRSLSRHPLEIRGDLVARPYRDQTIQSRLAKDRGDRAQEVLRQLRVALRKKTVSGLSEPPYLGRPPHS